MDKTATGNGSTGDYSTGGGSTGNYSTGHRSTGNGSTGNYSTGHRSTGNGSTGNYSTGNYSTGHRSTGNGSTGNYSTGDWSTGHRSTGNGSTGNGSTGDWSTGSLSTGNGSTGYWSTSNYSTGHFSTEDYSGFGCFDKPCTLEEWDAAYKPSWLYFNLIEWVPECDMTDEELTHTLIKESNPTYDTTGGYLKVYDYKEAFQASYNRATREEQLRIKELPNFDADKFYQISGIRIDEEPAPEEPKDKFVTDEDGKKYKLVEVDNE